MSLTASLNTALAGLGLSSRRAEIIATNVANADTPGYAMRRLSPGGPGLGSLGGASVGREVSPQLQALRRDAQSSAANASVAQSFYARLDTQIGDPGQTGSLQDRLAQFDAAITVALTDPTSDTRLAGLARSAQDLAKTVNSLGETVLEERQSADTQIGRAVDDLNTDLQSIAKLNADILRLRSHGQDPSPLMDQRQLLVDRVSEQIPVRQLPRDNEQLALVSKGGVMLLDGGRASELSFAPRAPITPDMVVGTHLSELQIAGKPVSTLGDQSQVTGGRLAALFEVRDGLAPRAMAQLDAFALELATRFQDSGTDPSLAAGQAGLFTDAGIAADALNVVGLSLRLDIHPDGDPGSPTTHWKYRDGFGATVQGPQTGLAQLGRFSQALGDVAAPVDPSISANPTDVTGLASSLRSTFSLERVRSDDLATQLATSADALSELRDGGKVDIDAEMRRLIEVEQAYAANARLIQAIDQMMNRLSEL